MYFRVRLLDNACRIYNAWSDQNERETMWNNRGLLYWLRKEIWFYWSESVDIKTWKLVKMGLHRYILTTLQSELRCNLQYVLDGETLSDEIKQETGVPQERNYHLYFLVFFCWSMLRIETGWIRGNFLYRRSSTRWQQSYLQQCINKIKLYCSGNKLKVNIAKTESHENQKRSTSKRQTESKTQIAQNQL